MRKKLNCVLLIDDNDSDNFYHSIVIEESGCAKQVVISKNGQEALDFLTTKENSKYPEPELIFLDINMPIMNGWGFLEQYEKLPEEFNRGAIIVMLSTSLNPDDRKKAKEMHSISAYRNKPISLKMIDNILSEFFNGT